MRSFCFLRKVAHVLLPIQQPCIKCSLNPGYNSRITLRTFFTSQRCSNEADILITKEQPVQATEIPLHIPVLVSEVIEHLNPQNGQTFLDMTFGAGGHTDSIFSTAPECMVYGLDRDPLANKLAEEYGQKNPRFIPLVGRFSEAYRLMCTHGKKDNSLDGILLDVGASSMQFDNAERGFSISKDGPLDMRMDAARCPDTPSAADVINILDEDDLYKIFKRYGEEKKPRLAARAIVNSRHTFGAITSTSQLRDIVASVYQMSHTVDKFQRKAHVATRIFQALRIFVNNELNELNNALETAYRLLRPGGCCVVISFHSLEDRIAKRHFCGIDMDLKGSLSVTDKYRNSSKTFSREYMDDLMRKKWEVVTRKVVLPSEEEETINPRSRSAKLRVAIKL